MSHYIDSPIGEIYFNSPNKTSVSLAQNDFRIRRTNISFVDEQLFFRFSDLYNWISMSIANMNGRYYLSIYLNNNTYELLDIYRSYKINHDIYDVYSFMQ